MRYAIATGEIITCFISSHHVFIKNEKIGECALKNTMEVSVESFDYHKIVCIEDMF